MKKNRQWTAKCTCGGKIIITDTIELLEDKTIKINDFNYKCTKCKDKNMTKVHNWTDLSIEEYYDQLLMYEEMDVSYNGKSPEEYYFGIEEEIEEELCLI